jgi:hypothetical protein
MNKKKHVAFSPFKLALYRYDYPLEKRRKGGAETAKKCCITNYGIMFDFGRRNMFIRTVAHRHRTAAVLERSGSGGLQ